MNDMKHDNYGPCHFIVITKVKVFKRLQHAWFHSCTPLHQQHQFNTNNKQINMNENFVKVK